MPNGRTLRIPRPRPVPLQAPGLHSAHPHSIAGMTRSSASAPPPAPLDDDDLLREILLRLPPQPSSLPRASLVCTRWRRILADHAFLRRFRNHHRHSTPLLGFFDSHICAYGVPVFTPMLDPPDRIPATRFSLLRILANLRILSLRTLEFMGCRDGLALVLYGAQREALVWDPLTDHHWRVPFPPGFHTYYCEHGISGRDIIINGGAVLRVADGDDGHAHGDCPLRPFKLVLVCNHIVEPQAYACVYDSEVGVWGNVVSVAFSDWICRSSPSTLVGNALCWLLGADSILEFDVQSQRLVVTERPPAGIDVTGLYGSLQILRTEGGRLGLAILSKSDLSIQLWERKSNCDGVVGWVPKKTIQLDKHFSARQCEKMLYNQNHPLRMQGYDEVTNTIFLSTAIGEFMLRLESMQLKLLFKRDEHDMHLRAYYPYRNLYAVGRVVGGGDAGV